MDKASIIRHGPAARFADITPVTLPFLQINNSTIDYWRLRNELMPSIQLKYAFWANSENFKNVDQWVQQLWPAASATPDLDALKCRPRSHMALSDIQSNCKMSCLAQLERSTCERHRSRTSRDMLTKYYVVSARDLNLAPALCRHPGPGSLLGHLHWSLRKRSRRINFPGVNIHTHRLGAVEGRA